MTSAQMPQNSKALQCYLILSLWIFLVVFGACKFFDWSRNGLNSVPIGAEHPHDSNGAIKSKRIFRICNFPEEIYTGEEGFLDPQKWSLKGLIILIRHGDRGPLQHVKNISNIKCNTEETDILKSYKSFLYNLTVTGKLQWTGPGPFHGFPVIPTSSHLCRLGQLTMQGISQHLNLGKILHRSYQNVWPKLDQLKPEEVMIYSTRYRRTFQSALAFLYGLIPNETLAKVNIFESQSMSFCFKDCECPVTEHLKNLVHKRESRQLKLHPAIETLSQSSGKLLFSESNDQTSLSHDPFVIRDAVLTFVCHKSPLPCLRPINCLRKQNVAGIIAFTDWMNYQRRKNIYWRRLCLLKSYGQMKHIVQQMLHMVGSNGPNLVLYSGHDFTLLQLTTALGLTNDPLLLKYASRLIFEVYQNDSDEKGIYFKLLSNGKDVTKQISFCKNIVTVGMRTNNVCKIENIVRFLHDDYFSSLNVSNFKDACVKSRELDMDNDFFQFR